MGFLFYQFIWAKGPLPANLPGHCIVAMADFSRMFADSGGGSGVRAKEECFISQSGNGRGTQLATWRRA